MSMMNTATNRPGIVIRQYLEKQGMTQSQFAAKSGITPKLVSTLCAGASPISAKTALGIEKVLKRPAMYWLRLQNKHDLETARSGAGTRKRARKQRVKATKAAPKAATKAEVVRKTRKSKSVRKATAKSKAKS